jgi:phage tail sheath gpL-like
MSKETDLGNLKSFLGASVAGIIAMYLTAKIFQAFMNLQSSGTLNLNNAIGQEGLIYLTIPGGERGKVQVVIQDSQKIFDAVSADGSEIKTGAQVKVTKVVSGNVMVVEKL